MRYKEYNQVEISHLYDNGKRVRNKIIYFNDIKKYFGLKEIHISVGRFKNLIEYLRDNNGSISGIDSYPIEIFYDYIIIDYDNINTDPIIEFLKYFEDTFNIPSQYITIYFSGYKGFHIYIPSVLVSLEPSLNANLMVGAFAKQITSNFFEIDSNIYRKGSTVRLPNTINNKSGLYKIPVFASELLDLNQIRELAKSPRYEKTSKYPDFSSMELTSYFKSIKYDIKKPTQREYITGRSDNNFVKKCIVNMLHGGGKDERGGRKNIAFRLAVHFAEQQIPPDITEAMLFKWNEKNSPLLKYSVLQSVIKSAYRNNYSFGCNDPVKQANCDSSCFLFKYRNNYD